MDEQKPMTVFELCRELNLKGFPQKREDTAWYFVRPDMMLKFGDVDTLKGTDGRSMISFNELIYYPKTADFIEWLGNDFQQLTKTNASGFFAYATHNAPGTLRSGGTTAWLALANVCYGKLLARDVDFPVIDVSESENVKEGIDPSMREINLPKD